MVVMKHLLVVIAALLPTATAQTCATISPAVAPTFASGYSGRVLMNGLKAPRGITTDNLGNLLVVEQGGAGVRWIQLTDNGGTNVCVKTSKQIISDRSLNHGIALSADNKILFVSSLAAVYSWSYDAATGAVSNKKTIISGMSNGGHSTRTLLTSTKQPNLLLVQRGSADNIDTSTVQASSGRSQTRIFKIDQIQSAAASYTSGELLGWGLRNSVGMTEHPTTGGIWSVENSCDDMTKNQKDIHNENPAEELNYHGTLSNASSPERGANYGYPACFAAWAPNIIPAPTGLKVGQQFLIDNPSGATSEAECAQRYPPKLSFPSHTAPLDIKFKADGSAAYISFHGSWDRSPPDGYRLSKVLFDTATGMPKEPSTSTTAAQNIMYNANNGACPNRCFRPAGLTWDSNSTRLFMTSDSTNEIWIIGGV